MVVVVVVHLLHLLLLLQTVYLMMLSGNVGGNVGRIRRAGRGRAQGRILLRSI